MAALVRSFSFAYFGLRAARSLHRQLLSNVLGSSLRWLESNPLGRVLNRLNRDTFTVDDQFPFITNIFLAQATGVAGSAVVLALTR